MRPSACVRLAAPGTAAGSRTAAAPTAARAAKAAGHTWCAQAARGPGTTATARAALSARTARRASTARAARAIADVRKQERPLIVVRRAVVDANRRFLALAHHTHDAAAGLTAAELARSATEDARRPLCGRAALLGLTEAWRLAAAAASSRLLLGLALLRDAGRNGDDLELAVGYRILVLLTEKALLHQQVDCRREVAGTHFSLIQIHRAGILLAAKDELGFFLALHFVPPHRHRHGHQDRHDPDAHEQSRHGVSALAVLTL